jgi:hypothetical protein
MKPGDILAAAEDLMTRPDATSAGLWPRAAALMARQALETAIAQYWNARTKTGHLASCSMRTQLACLPFYLDRQTARQGAYVWAALSSACHYHSYELAPTAAELTRWITDVRTVIAHIESGAHTTAWIPGDGSVPWVNWLRLLGTVLSPTQPSRRSPARHLLRLQPKVIDTICETRPPDVASRRRVFSVHGRSRLDSRGVRGCRCAVVARQPSVRGQAERP